MYSNYSDDLVGKEYKPYWQKKYNNAIVEIINYFNLIATNR
jgi:hypothetical protein